MGGHALSRWFFGLCAIAALAGAPCLAQAAATAEGVALGAGAGCSSADLNITLTTSGANREFGQSTNLAGATLGQFENQTQLINFSGTYSGYGIGVSPPQPADTLIGAYAYVGETPPAAGNTAEFFVYYNCTTRQVLLSCFGPYGTCPRTAQQAAARLEVPAIPTLSQWGIVLTILLLGSAGLRSMRRRAA